uniref:C2H2-type domain-containing protein n=1 Tax=Elaeophora elaphi TaxID=1147741 RepID=A0A0R3RSL0_9BILA
MNQMHQTVQLEPLQQSSGWKRKAREGQEWEAEDFGPVTWHELSNMRRNSVILFNSELYPAKISEWSLRAEPGRDNKYYICVLCRRLQDRGKRLIPPVKFGPPARILVRNGRFLTHPDYPRTPHICGFGDNPMSDRAVVLARRAMIRARTEISEDGMTPREKINQVLISFREDGKYADLSAEEIDQMEDMVLGRIHGRMWSESSSVRSLYINRRKLMNANQNDKPRKVYECPVVDCDFLTFASGMIDIHVSEKHRVVNDPNVAGSAAFEAQYPVSAERNDEVDVSNLSVESSTQNVPVYSTVQMDLEPNSVCDPEGDYGPVIYEALSYQRRKSIILFESRLFPNKISEWALKMPTNDMTMYYTCVLCRKLKDKGKRQEPPVQYPPPARIVVRNGRFMVHPDYPKTPHICDFANNPLSDRQSVLSRRVLAKRPVNGLIFGVPVQKPSNYVTNQDMNYRYITIAPSECSSSNIYVVEEPGTWPQDPEISLSDDSDSEYEALLRLDVNSNISEVPSAAVPVHSDVPSSSETDFAARGGKRSQIYNCSIVGCNFMTSTLADLDIHLGEHELLDEEQVVHYEIFGEAGSPYANHEAVEIVDEGNLSEPSKKQQRALSSNGHILLAVEDNKIGCKEDCFEKSDLPTDVPSGEVHRNPEDLRASIRRHLQNIERSLENIEMMQLLEIDGSLLRIQQQLYNIQSSNMQYFHDAGELLQNTESLQNVSSFFLFNGIDFLFNSLFFLIFLI